MPYKVTLTLLGGQHAQLPEIHHAPTPQMGDMITVGYPGGLAKAKVVGVRAFPPKATAGSAVETVDQIDAQEM